MPTTARQGWKSDPTRRAAEARKVAAAVLTPVIARHAYDLSCGAPFTCYRAGKTWHISQQVGPLIEPISWEDTLGNSYYRYQRSNPGWRKGRWFEDLVANRLRSMGWRVMQTKGKGPDMVAVNDNGLVVLVEATVARCHRGFGHVSNATRLASHTTPAISIHAATRGSRQQLMGRRILGRRVGPSLPLQELLANVA